MTITSVLQTDLTMRIGVSLRKLFSSIVPSMLCEAKWQLQLSFLLNIAFFKEENVSRMKNELNFQLKYGFKNIRTGVLIS